MGKGVKVKPDERKAKIEEYGRGFDFFSAALAQVPLEARKWKPAPGEWSVHQIILHMADSETFGALRARTLIAEPGSTLMPYDDPKWADSLNYQDQDAEDALQLFKLMRQTTYRMHKTLPAQVFSHAVVHPEQGYPEYGATYTLEKWLNIYTRHVRDHVEQLKQTHQAWRAQHE